MITQQQTEALFMDPFVFELFSHWQSSEPGHPYKFVRMGGGWAKGDAPNGWANRIRVVSIDDSERIFWQVVTHSVLMKAMRLTSNCDTRQHKRLREPDDETVAACQMFLAGAGDEVFDPHTIDQVLQVAVYGGILHPHNSH